MQANTVAVRFVLSECIVLHFECLSKRSLPELCVSKFFESFGEHSSWNVQSLEAL